jgi:HAD superfamily hydrolase (TIGR01509 family)
VPILEYIDRLETEEARKAANRILDDYEMEAARRSVPNEGAEEIISLLKSNGIRLGIISRNSLASIIEAMKHFHSVAPDDFTVIISRENSSRPKPHPDGVDRAAELFGIPPQQILVVGDYVFDIAAGKAAGAATAFLTNGAPVPAMDAAPDYTISRLAELKDILRL